MRIQYLVAASSLAALAFASPAAAQVEEQPFNGFYAGISGGYDVQPNDVGEAVKFDRDLNGSYEDTVTTIGGTNAFAPGFCNGAASSASPTTGCGNDRDNWGYSGRIGYDRQYGPLVVGVVAEFGNSEIRDSVSAFSTTPASYTLNRELLYTGSARGRVGFAANRTLFYGTGGLAYGRVNNYFRTTNTANGFESNGDSHAFGFAAGGGIEQRIGRHMSFGLEYMFNRLQNADYRVRVSGGPATSPFTLGGAGGTDLARSYEKFRYHSMRATLSYRF